MSPSAELISPRTNEELNLAVLQRHEPLISTIVSIAPYAVLYTFSPTTIQWEKTGIEGTLFLCGLHPSSAVANRFAVFILNRRGLDNFFLELHSADAVEITEEYVIVQADDTASEDPKVYGLWIYQEVEPGSTAKAREKNAGLIESCARIAGLSKDSGTDILATAAIGENALVGQVKAKPEISRPTRPGDASVGDARAATKHETSAPAVVQPMPQFQPSADTQFFLSAKKIGPKR